MIMKPTRAPAIATPLVHADRLFPLDLTARTVARRLREVLEKASRA